MSNVPYQSYSEGLSEAVRMLAERDSSISKDEMKVINAFRTFGYGSVRILGHSNKQLVALKTEDLESALAEYNNLEVHYSPQTVLCLRFELAKRKTCTLPKS